MRILAPWACAAVVGVTSFVLAGCAEPGRPLASRDQTFAELRAVRRGVRVRHAGEAEREPFARERLTDGAEVTIADGGLAWLRRDGGAALLVRGPARLTLRDDHVVVREGRVFADASAATGIELRVPSTGREETLTLRDVRASLDVTKGGAVSAYVLGGALRTEGGVTAAAGQVLAVDPSGAATVHPQTAWADWTGGLAVTQPAAEPAPYGIGVVGARLPGALGAPRRPLSIQKLDVRVTVDGDLAVTDVEEVFFNPTAETVEGLFRFRTPPGATLHRFGVDRDGQIVWGRPKEQAAAAAQYQANVYRGSTEDPALLEWDAPGVYKARLYPIEPGGKRRVITRYAEWLARDGARGERRLYTYPMAVEGGSPMTPRIEELSLRVDLARSGATELRSGMAATRTGSIVTVRQWDVVPRADFALELLDMGASGITARRAPHALDLDTLPTDERKRAVDQAKGEPDYVLLPIRAPRAAEPKGGLDLAIVVDTSAATEESALRLAVRTTSAILTHLGPEDRVAVWAGDAALRSVGATGDRLTAVTPETREALVEGLAKVERGGATDLGALLTEAASRLDPARRGAVVYVGDGRPTVGELTLGALQTRLGRLDRPVRLLSVGVGHEANMALLGGLSRGAFATRVTDSAGAAMAALRLLGVAERPVWLGVGVDLGPGVERVVPRDLGLLAEGDTALVVGRVTGALPASITVRGSGGEVSLPLTIRAVEDDGDERRRWAEGRLGELLDASAGRAAVVEVGVRYGIVTPFTSLYVPSKRELLDEQRAAAEDGTAGFTRQLRRDDAADDKEGGTGTRAKGEEGATGKPDSAGKRYAVAGPKDNPGGPAAERAAALGEATEFGMIGLLSAGAGGGAEAPKEAPRAAAGLGLSGVGEGGGGLGEGGLGTLGHGAGVASGQGFGAGGGRVGGVHRQQPVQVRLDRVSVSGKLPEEVVRRIVRQNLGRLRLCYEASLKQNPSLEGRLSVRFDVIAGGAVKSPTEQASSLPDKPAVACVLGALSTLSFPEPGDDPVAVDLSVVFAPVDGASTAPATSKPTARLGDPSFVAWRCSVAATLSLEERVVLWRERLARAKGDVALVRDVYMSALSTCEAAGWRDRARLLGLLLDALPTARPRVALWRAFGADSAAGDLLYRSILARTKTAADLRELHDALGLRRMDPGELERAIDRRSPEERIRILRGLVERWPDDEDVALRLLDAHEDAGDAGGGQAFARALRARPGASARVRTAVAEYHLRLAKRAPDGGDAEEARRCLGEIVEFSPDDPAARRLLGDLLLAHGFFAESSRQYETLKALIPDDATVSILLARAADGVGRVEEAIQWTEKASVGSAPDGRRGTGRTARAFAAVSLAWARDAATKAGRTDEAARLRERAKRLTGGDASQAGARIFLTWSHPELHPGLWSNARGGFLPSEDGDPLLGLAEVALQDGRALEIRVDPADLEHTARLGAEARLTAIVGEGTIDEAIVIVPVTFDRAKPVRRFRLEGRSLVEVP